ncbi:MAG: glycerol-3-phosphate dehydrogenase/oxidase [Thermoplasmatota archaeon]
MLPPGPGGKRFDLLVVGGGINGAAITRDAARRGLRVLLVEAHDWGWGTSSKSSKLAHGGLRYLEQFELGLVHEALQERERLLRQAPHLVRPLEFLYPIYPHVAARHTIRIGLWLYDLLSHGRSLPGRRYLPRAQALARLPALNPHALAGAATFYDAQILSVERLVVEIVADARAAGAVCLNHTHAALRVEGGAAVGATLTTRGGVVEVEAAAVVNATGAWVDETLAGFRRGPPLVRKTKGIHVVVPRIAEVALIAKARRDGRTFFVIPWKEYSVVGTTDTEFRGDPADAAAQGWEVDYLIDEARRYLPGPWDDLRYTYAGVRALVNQPGRTESNTTRRHVLFDHAREGCRGLWSLQGGKITTARSLAEEAVDRIASALGWPAAQRHPTRDAPLPGAPPEPWVTWRREAIEAAVTGWRLPRNAAEHLVDTYGRLWSEVVAADATARGLEAVVSTSPHLYCEVTYSVLREEAKDLSDVMLRRMGLGLAPDGNPEAAHRVAGWMARLLSWTDAEIERQLALYATEVRGLAVPWRPVPVQTRSP